MNAEFASLWQLFLRTFQNPKEVAEELVSMRIDRGALWLMMAIVVLLSVFVFALGSAIAPPPPNAPTVNLSPFAATVLIGSLSVMFVFVLYYVGRAMGGQGTFGSTILILVWHHIVTLGVQIVQLTLLFVAPFLAVFAALLGFFMLLYILLQFINVLHRFDSFGKAVGTLLVSIAGVLFGLTIILSMIGITAEGMV